MTQQNWLTRSFTRRQFMGLSAVAGAGCAYATSLYTRAFFDKLSVTEYTLATKRWPKEYKDLRIAFLTDLHVGCASVDLDSLAKIVHQVNALKADIILLGGDFVTVPQSSILQHLVPPVPIARILANLRAPLGIYAVLGNHDWGTDGMAVWHALEKRNIRVLENNAMRVENNGDDFWIVGLADYLTRRPDYPGAMREADDHLPKIVLSHDPFTFKDLAGEPVVQLSGHTHGGQVSLPLVGPMVNPTHGAPMDWLYGVVENGDARMIISSGVGTSVFPIKNTPCEVVLLTLAPQRNTA